MTRARAITVGSVAVAALLAAEAAHHLHDGVKNTDPNLHVNSGNDALPAGARKFVKTQVNRGEGKRKTRAAVAQLSQSQGIVLGHIHPRWLRAEIAHMLDIGVTVTQEMIAGLRQVGPLNG